MSDYYVTQDGKRWPKSRTTRVVRDLPSIFSIGAKLKLIKIEEENIEENTLG